MDEKIEVKGIGKIMVDNEYGGESLVIVEEDKIGMKIEKGKESEIEEIGVKIKKEENEKIGFRKKEREWRNI